MLTLNIDDDIAALLKQLSDNQHISPAQAAKNILTEYFEDRADAAAADMALAELEDNKDSVITLEEWEKQLNALEHRN